VPASSATSFAAAGGSAATHAPGGAPASARRWAWAGLACVLAGALVLRLWGVKQGLPYAYNADENAHFVPRAIGMFVLGPNPHYFANPPAFTYLLHLVFAVWFGGRAGVSHAYAANPTEVFVVARVTAAVLGTIAVWLLYLVGARLFTRGVGLLAAALMAVAFLPVFYAHLALNDVPTLAPLTLSLLGTAGVLRRGRARDYLVAGVGLGVGCATKYTAGIVLLPLLAAAAAQLLGGAPAEHERGEAPGEHERGEAPGVHERGGTSGVHERGGPPPDKHERERHWARSRPVIGGLAIAGFAALGSFLIANPYAALDFQSFHAGIAHQSAVSEEAQGKLGAGQQSGVLYYLWSLTWGLGWAPALAALGGAVTVWRTERRLGWLLAPWPVLFLVFMGLQGRYFGRWLLPIFPIVCLLAAFFALRLARGIVLAVRSAQRRRAGGDRVSAGVDRPAAGVERASAGVERASVGSDRASAASEQGSQRSFLGVLLVALAAIALCAQGALYSVHSGMVLARADTRNLTRAWMVAHVPVGAHIVVEPVVPDPWAQDIGHPTPTTRNGFRWIKYTALRSIVNADGSLAPARGHTVNLEDYERTLSPALISYYEQRGYCWVVSGSTQSGRALADQASGSPQAVPHAVAYYRALAQQAEVAYHVSPYSPGKGPVRFNFDWTFDFYPLAYARPGPEMTVYRLRGGRCRA
jgi:hypothetical protein